MADMNLHEEDEEVSSKEQTSSTSNVEEEKQGLDDTLPFGGESSLAQSSILTDEEHILRYRETQTSLSLALLTSQENERRRIQALPAHLRGTRLAEREAELETSRQKNAARATMVVLPDAFRMLNSWTKADWLAWEQKQCQIDNLRQSGSCRDKMSDTFNEGVIFRMIVMVRGHGELMHLPLLEITDQMLCNYADSNPDLFRGYLRDEFKELNTNTIEISMKTVLMENLTKLDMFSSTSITNCLDLIKVIEENKLGKGCHISTAEYTLVRNWFKNKLWLSSVMTGLTPTTINSIGVKLFDGPVADRPKNIQELLELLLREHKGLMALLVLCEQQLGPIHGLKRTREDRNLEKESGRGGEAEVTLRGEAEVTLKLDRSLVERGGLVMELRPHKVQLIPRNLVARCATTK